MSKREFHVCHRVEGPADRQLGELGRRDFLFRMGGGLGSLALTHLLHQDGFLANTAAAPLAPKAPHFQTPAKACIFFFMYGGASHIDTFDPKPALANYHGTPTYYIPLEGGSKEKSLYVASPFKFQKHGRSGLEVSELLPHLATCVDDMAVVRSLHTDSSIHPNAVFQMNLGLTAPGGPSMGAWVLYGLGTENQDLPGFVVLPDSRGSVWSGPANWSNGYLPAVYQGTLLNPEGTPIVDLQPPQGVSPEQQQSFVDLLNKLNRGYLDSNPRNSDLLARMKSYELAFRMQMSVPEVVDIESEAEKPGIFTD